MPCRSSIIREVPLHLVLGLAVMVGLGEVLLSSMADLSLLVDVGGMVTGGVGWGIGGFFCS